MKETVVAWPKNPTSLSTHLAEGVLRLIREEGLAAGDRLPSVKRAVRTLPVATPTMREALRLLRNGGKPRHSPRLRHLCPHPEPRLMLTNPYARTLSTETIMNLLQARLLIEPPVAELAALNASDRHLAELGDSAQRRRAPPLGPGRRRRRARRRQHAVPPRHRRRRRQQHPRRRGVHPHRGAHQGADGGPRSLQQPPPRPRAAQADFRRARPPRRRRRRGD